MKTAISIPDQVFESAEKLARRLGKSRSQLYTQALSSYLDKNNDQSVEAQLNAVYDNADSRLDSNIRDMQSRSISNNSW